MQNYKESKMFKEWIKKDLHRVYLQGWAIGQMLGFEFSYYKTGNISSCRLYSEYLSNSEGGRVKSALYQSKVWFDMNNESWTIRLTDTITDLIPDADQKLRLQLDALEISFENKDKTEFDSFVISTNHLMKEINHALIQCQYRFANLKMLELKQLIIEGKRKLGSYPPFQTYKKEEIGNFLLDARFDGFMKWRKETNYYSKNEKKSMS